ncbi:endo-1,3(4)-beta-glucanase, partial [Cunninghamella echinulata]
MSSVKQPIKAAINITNSIPQEFKQIYHPYLPKYATSNTEKDQVVPTNSWISNLFYPSLNNTAPTNSDPYTIRVLDTLVDGNPGLSITQQEIKETGSYQDSKSVNSTIATTMSDYLINGQTVEIRYSCEEWGKTKVSNQNNNNNITTQVISWDHFGATIRLMSQKNAKKYIDFPIARGMAYVTAHYHDLTPHFFTQRAIVHINSDGPKEDQNGNTIYHGKRFKIQFNDKEESIFIIYALDGTLSLTFAGLSRLVAKKPYNGTIRIAKIPKKEDEPIFDHYKNAWATGGLVKWKENSYAIQWKTEGQGDPLIFAYPHHIQTLTNKITSIKLSSASKGKMTAVIGNTWIMNESTVLLTDLKDRDVKDDAATWFFPQHPKLNPQVAQDVLKYLEMDIESDYHNTTNKNDNYFSGKALQKYALLALILNQPNITGLYKPQLAQLALDKIKNAFSVFLQNRQMDPFFYDVIYKGIVARSGLPKSMGGTGNPGAAFGHTYYNDHHYHHGYLIVT